VPGEELRLEAGRVAWLPVQESSERDRELPWAEGRTEAQAV